MTSISAASAGSHQSPLQRLQQELQSQVSTGAISSSDQSALSTALTDIDTALQQSRSSGAPPSKDEMQSRIEDLISSEVSNGTLTSEQAEELKSVFQSAFTGGPGGPPPDDGSSDSTTTDSTSSSSTDQTTAEILQQFLEALQQSQSSASSYGANGSSTGNSSLAALLIDYKS
ncbi:MULTISPECIES: hypothetical protein [unclassified Bradyrhizobium]|uniref:hypothetical protein n=1 Tax=unclassified Bradyrhizobium TaxID=2631580 RepID=UPI001CD24046|nr:MULTISPECIES: hypothetical protein [unclassified Bradyrhizobium]MCA1426627.1 hypothetical protein [Bradyrhizobium sp. NBAIM16]MCA1505414.1 hypothetical protein [Bradyrhizobium sp. NBAIM02]